MIAASGVLGVALALSGVGLMCGPLILSLGRGRTTTTVLVEGLTLGLLPTMVVLRLLPHVMDGIGPLAIVLAALAFFGLRAFDRAHHRAAARLGRTFIYSTLALHSFTDGVSLAAAVAATPTRSAMDITLTLAFVIHRLPEGLFIATTLLPSYGWRGTLLRTFGLVLATVAGGLAGGALLPHLPERLFDAVVAVGLGAMLQLVLHSHADRGEGPTPRALSALALLVGAGLAIAVPAPHDLLRLSVPHELSMLQTLGPLFVQTAPAMLLGLALTATARRWLGRTQHASPLIRALASTAGPNDAVAGARTLLESGASFAAAVTYALGAPALGLEALFVSMRLFGVPFAGVRLLAAVGLAASVGAMTGGPAARVATPARHVSPVLSAAGVLVSYLVGLCIAAALEAAVEPGVLVPYAVPIAIVLLLAVAVPLQLALVGLLPVVAVLVHKGLPREVALTLLLIGPTSSPALAALVVRARGKRALLIAGVGLGLGAIVAGALAGPLPIGPALHALIDRTYPLGHALLEKGLAAVLVGVIMWTLLELGPHAWFAQLGISGEARRPDDGHAHRHHE